MAIEQLVIGGIVQNGVVVPAEGPTLPEGTRVEIIITLSGFSSELRAELDGWERASDEAWAMIDRWEQEETQA